MLNEREVAGRGVTVRGGTRFGADCARASEKQHNFGAENKCRQDHRIAGSGDHMVGGWGGV